MLRQGLWQQYDKLIAAKAPGDLSGAQGGTDDIGEGGQSFIASRMPVLSLICLK